MLCQIAGLHGLADFNPFRRLIDLDRYFNQGLISFEKIFSMIWGVSVGKNSG